MTTSNQFITVSFRDVNYLPLEAVHRNDTSSFVYTLNNNKKIVEVGKTNENHIIVEGIEKGVEVYLTLPEESNL
jgi:hypothetical protein